MNIKHLSLFSFCFSAIFAVSSSHSQSVSIVNDTFPLPTSDLGASYFGTSGANAIQPTISGANTVSIGLVTGTSGRQLHALFDSVTLAEINDTITASLTFITPPTTAQNNNDDLRFGLFDDLGRPEFNGDLDNDGDEPSFTLVGVPGVAIELDVDTASDPDARNINIRQSNPSETGNLIGTNRGVDSVSSSEDLGYVFAANTTYNVTLSITRVAGDSIDDLEVTSTFTDVTNNQSIGSHTDTITPTVSTDPAPLPGATEPVFVIDPADDDPVPSDLIIGNSTPSAEPSYSFGLFSIGASTNAFGSTTSFDVPADNGIEIIAFTVDAGLAGGAAPTDDNNCAVVPNGDEDFTVICP